MDSSPDLSLKLRRGSSDSRDNFYMDFAQGIDSDIEEVDNSQLPAALPGVEGGVAVVPPPPLPTATAPLTLSEEVLMMVAPPPPTVSSMATPLPTLTETEDMPPTPPPQQLSLDATSPPASPTTSVLELIPPPPPPLSPMDDAGLRTDDETDDADEAGDEAEEEEEDGEVAQISLGGQALMAPESEADDDEDEEKSTPPPPLPPLPSNLSYVQGTGAGMLPSAPITPPLTKSPSTSPSPPATPPPYPQLSKMVSPPPQRVAQTQPLTPSSESDQSQPNSPPPLPHHGARVSPPISVGETQQPPPEQPATSGGQQLAAEEYSRSLDNEDESTTITTPPSNGYSASSIIAPPPEHFGELEEDAAVTNGFVPPPAGLEDRVASEQDEDEADEEELTKVETDDLSVDKISLTRGDEADADDDEPAADSISSPRAASIASGGIISTSGAIAAAIAAAGGRRADGSPKQDSRVPSRSVSRSSINASRIGSRAASRSGSVRGGSLGSRAAAPPPVLSPQASLKSVKSPVLSIKSGSHRSGSGSPLVVERVQSPPVGEGAPVMPSPPLMRSPPPELAKSPPRQMHSPPRITTPPRVYSPPLVSSPPKLAQLASGPAETAAAAAIQKEQTSSATDGPIATLSYQDEQTPPPPLQAQTQAQSTPAVVTTQPQPVRAHFTSSHHHYHLPHQFQHPHHQNHHTHSVRVPTPTVPSSYAPGGGGGPGRGGSGSGGGEDSSSSPSYSRRTQFMSAAAAPTSALLIAPSEGTSVTAISPGRMSARSGSQHHVTIDESSLPHKSSVESAGPSGVIIGPGTGHGDDGGGDGGGGSGGDSSEPPSSPGSSSQRQLTNQDSERPNDQLALMYHSHQLTNYPVLPAIKRTHRPSFVYPPMPRIKAGDALATLFSALYGKLLVVMGIAFPMAEVISTYIPPSFYEVYYLYLYIGSMIFLLFMYATMLWGRPKLPVPITSPTKSTAKVSASDSLDESDTDSTSTRRNHMPPVIPVRRPSLLSPLGRQHHYGSFYLRMGAVAFGIGSMIYSGLEFGQYFELNPDTKCHNVLLALTPATRMAFIFIQMYFIFLNNEQIKVYRYKIIARFGLMHMIGTNLAVWLNVLIQETKHEILTFYNPENRTLRISHRIPGHSRGHAVIAPTVIDPTAHLRVARGLKGPYQIFECRRTNIIGTLVQDASPFLFPCTIEYSLICAAILYVMWRSISRPQSNTPQRPDMISSPMKRSPHHYSVDCARAHKGLFVGILILVLTIISLIIFFVLISRPEFVALAVTEVTICELLIYGTATIATLLGMIQIRHLQYDAYRSFSLDDILLVGAQTGSFLYNIFTVIAGHFTLRSDDMLVPINALASIVQTACQTMFILDASRRQAVSPEHIRKKPGREIVTFMLVVNLAMWAISTLEKSRAESHPIQLNFYGLWAWTIITHVSMPLAIFYRFHSTVCLCEIWKRAYKLKPTYM
ncbi:proton channel OtopLc [Scaptodrosophila lebanonensis]|uniref:Proton channel OtopLc n=1 Tax=Drosophila lebanonensis TaxID=7225 RepID=A0A6J2TX09_DROLE|nr:proton channel OtopLc [Scaptodrosophila lebanonensis]